MKREPKTNGRSSKPKSKPRRTKRIAGDLKSIEELAAEQGVAIPQRWEDLYGAGEHLWESDEEFDEFLKGIYERRQRGR